MPRHRPNLRIITSSPFALSLIVADGNRGNCPICGHVVLGWTLDRCSPLAAVLKRRKCLRGRLVIYFPALQLMALLPASKLDTCKSSAHYCSDSYGCHSMAKILECLNARRQHRDFRCLSLGRS